MPSADDTSVLLELYNDRKFQFGGLVDPRCFSSSLHKGRTRDEQMELGSFFSSSCASDSIV